MSLHTGELRTAVTMLGPLPCGPAPAGAVLDRRPFGGEADRLVLLVPAQAVALMSRPAEDLDDLAAAWLATADHVRLDYEHLDAPPFPGSDPEYNLNIDPVAAQVVFNESRIPQWHVPRNVYRQ